MRKRFLLLAIATVLACVTAATGLAAGSTQVTQISFTKPSNVCGISGTTVGHGTNGLPRHGRRNVLHELPPRRRLHGRRTGKSTTLSFAGPQTQTSPAVIDAQAGTVTITTTYGGLFEKLSITRGPTLSRDAGTVTLIDVYEYTGDPSDPVGDSISETVSGLHGPHPDLLSGFTVFCDVVVPYLQAP